MSQAPEWHGLCSLTNKKWEENGEEKHLQLVTPLVSCFLFRHTQPVDYFFLFKYLKKTFGWLQTHPMGLEPTTSPSKQLLWEKEVSVEL
jgi:hypothetical protein